MAVMMNLVACCIFVLTSVLAHENSDDFINEINSKQSFWKAGRNFDEDMPMSSFKGLLGLRSSQNDKNIPTKHHEFDVTEGLPESFDARTQWPLCKSIGEIADQSACGSCWAVAVASTISDRVCIHSDSKLQPRISARNLMSCAFSLGCYGGSTSSAWEYWRFSGLVTGGAYGSKIGCQPYPFAQCEHHSNEGSRPACPNDTYPTPNCVKKCDNSTLDYASDLHYGQSVYGVSSDENQIQAEILKNGPIAAGFTVFADLFHYKSGVYVRTVGTLVGRHAVRVIGWGVENGTKYWLVANSWNEDWGDKGFFKIRRGVDECAFETEMTAGLPKL